MIKYSDISEKIKRSYIGFVSFNGLLLIMVLLIVGIYVPCENLMSKEIKEKSKDSMFSIMSNVENQIKVILEDSTADVLKKDLQEIDADKWEKIMKGAKLKNIGSSYTYVVDSKGIMIYHPTKEKIGLSVESEAIQEVVKNFSTEKEYTMEMIEYEYNDNKKYAVYTVVDHKYIVVLTCDEDELLSGVKDMRKSVITVIVFLTIFVVIIGCFIIRLIITPIGSITKEIENIGELNMKATKDEEKLCRTKGEIGIMAKAVKKLRENLYDVVDKINKTSLDITKTAKELNIITKDITDFSSDNSSTTQELSAAMQETTVRTKVISKNIDDIVLNTEGVSKKTEDAKKLSEQIMSRADKLKKEMQMHNTNVTCIYENIKEQSKIAIEQSRSVSEINAFTDTIMEIADQTSLLALNASIEAARAGDVGKGFSVVANEIANLADQSSKAVINVSSIVDMVNTSVKSMTECIDEIISFVESTVIADYISFIGVGEQYDNDARNFMQYSMKISSDMDSLENMVREMTESVKGIEETIEESAIGIGDIAGKTSDVVTLATDNYEKVQENIKNADMLNKVVDKFIV